MTRAHGRFLLLFFILFTCIPLNGQSLKKELIICWDTSRSMQNRDIEKDFSVLEEAFREFPNSAVTLILFGMESESKSYEVRAGDWLEIKKELTTVIYDGAKVYSQLNSLIEDKKVLLFTDGNQIIAKDYLSLGEGSTLINSSPLGNRKLLRRTALLNRAVFKDLAPESSLQNRVVNSNKVNGTVYVDNERAANISIQIRGKEEASLTNTRGEFSLDAVPADSIIINNNPDMIYAIKDLVGKDIFLKSSVTSLDEVVLIENRVPQQSIEDRKKEGQGYSVQSIRDDDITTVNTNLNSVVNGRFSGVTVGGGVTSGDDKDLSKFIVRGQSSLLLNNYGLIVVDGVPIKQSNSAGGPFQAGDAVASTNFIDPALIEEITVLKGLAATNRFGTLGSNGVLLITTKTAATRNNNGEAVDRARLTDNVYDQNEALSTTEDSPFLKTLSASKNTEEAYLSYSSLRELNQKNIAFYLEAFDFFSTKDQSLATRIVSNLLDLYPENVEVLRSLDLYFSSMGKNRLAQKVNNQILEIKPYNLHANYRKVMLAEGRAAQTLLENKYALLKGRKKYKLLNASPIEKTLRRDIKNYIEKNRSQLNLGGIEPDLANNVRYDARFVFEWNNAEAEFELQFVNPQNRFYNWIYSNTENPERVNSGISAGYMLEEFEFYGQESKGNWIVNVKYLGNISDADKMPLVLKCTLYTDFGKSTEQKQNVVVHLSRVNQKRNVLDIVIN